MSPAALLLRWYTKYGRDLPWRHTRDPYRILVSEIMLQQTQVNRGLVFYARWLETFPDWKALADASNAEVIAAWSGLGYNRRALMLRDIARTIIEHGEPKTEAGWQTLKGIGPYTAAAISAFALHQRTIPVDTNIRRVLGRLLLGKPFSQLSDDDKIRRAADDFIPRRGKFYDVPQAIFDLATAICTKTPDCAVCPLRAVCPSAKKFLSGRVRIPKAAVKKAVESKHRDKPHPDRIYRGRILKLAQTHPGISLNEVGPHIDPKFNAKKDAAWLAAMIGRLEKDAMVTLKQKRLWISSNTN